MVESNKQNLAEYIYKQAIQKLDNFEDIESEISYLTMLGENLSHKLLERYLYTKNTTGSALNDLRHKFKIFMRTLVG